MMLKLSRNETTKRAPSSKGALNTHWDVNFMVLLDQKKPTSRRIVSGGSLTVNSGSMINSLTISGQVIPSYVTLTLKNLLLLSVVFLILFRKFKKSPSLTLTTLQ